MKKYLKRAAALLGLTLAVTSLAGCEAKQTANEAQLSSSAKQTANETQLSSSTKHTANETQISSSAENTV